MPPRGLDELTVGVLGTGRIGGGLARRLTRMGVRVIGYDLVPDAALAELPGFAYTGSLDDLLARADVLSLHVPLTAATRGLLDEARLARLPRGALLVNTARGAVVDQAAVLAALEAGELGGYAADVLPGEPAPPDLARFRGHPRTILTPHTAAYDRRALAARYATTARIVRALQAGDHAALTPYLAES